jgi:hypothetical protein
MPVTGAAAYACPSSHALYCRIILRLRACKRYACRQPLPIADACCHNAAACIVFMQQRPLFLFVLIGAASSPCCIATFCLGSASACLAPGLACGGLLLAFGRYFAVLPAFCCSLELFAGRATYAIFATANRATCACLPLYRLVDM